jgi:hypothetical protein
VDERHGDVQAPLHAARVGATDAVGGLAQAEALEQCVDPLLQRAAAQAIDLALQAQVLAPGGLTVYPGLLRDHADQAAHGVGVAHHVVAGDRGRARVGQRKGGEDLHRRRLAGPVGPEQAEHRAGLDGKVQSVEGPHVAGIRLVQVPGFDCVFHDESPIG